MAERDTDDSIADTRTMALLDDDHFVVNGTKVRLLSPPVVSLLVVVVTLCTESHKLALRYGHPGQSTATSCS